MLDALRVAAGLLFGLVLGFEVSELATRGFRLTGAFAGRVLIAEPGRVLRALPGRSDGVKLGWRECIYPPPSYMVVLPEATLEVVLSLRIDCPVGLI